LKNRPASRRGKSIAQNSIVNDFNYPDWREIQLLEGDLGVLLRMGA
jgi:hypothetical protein